MSEDIDHHSKAFARDHRDIYRTARTHCPVLRSNAHGGFTILTRYADCRAVLRDNENFLSGRFTQGRLLGGGVAIPPNTQRIGMIEMDGAQAKTLREVLQPWFSIPAIREAHARIRQIVNWVIDEVIEKGTCDVVADIARPVPTLLILDILGLPFDRFERYSQVLHEAVAKTSGSADGLRWLTADLNKLVTGGTYEEGGLVDAMMQTTACGSPLGIDLVCELTMMLLFGGSDTTIATIGHAMRHFTSFPHHRERLIRDPSLIPRAIEELLRLYSPTTGSARTVAEDIEIAETKFRRGDRVLCALNSANLDESVFVHPDDYDQDRPIRPHLAFGWGQHACLGQNLARADMKILLEEILARLPDFAVDMKAARPYESIPLVNGYHEMPLRFTPGQPLSTKRAAWPKLTAPRLSAVK